MSPQDNSNSQEHRQPRPKWNPHNGKFCSTANREKIVNALAAGEPKYLIAKALHVSQHTVDAVALQEWTRVANRKARIAAQFERIATKSCDLLAQKLETDGHKLTANQLVPIAGVAADKLLALRGEQNLNVHIEHDFPQINIFQAFHQFHADVLKIIKAREVGQQDSPHTLPEPPDSQDHPQP